MKTILSTIIVLTCVVSAQAINIDTVLIGNQGNAPDNTGYGAVEYAFRIGKTEITNAQYVVFLNAVAGFDIYGLYRSSMGYIPDGGGITAHFNPQDPFHTTYSVTPPTNGITFENKPVSWVSWGSAARFANWMHNGQPTGLEDLTTTEDGAYTLNGATTIDEFAVNRNPGARWWLPSENEWYKAAYYDPVQASYYDYPTGTDVPPNKNLPSGDTGNSANFNNALGSALYQLTNAGAYTKSKSPYGTFDQGGNLSEWNEARSGTTHRGVRGGWYSNISGVEDLASSTRDYKVAYQDYRHIGFRIATVPEPSTIVLMFIGFVGFGVHRSRLYS